MSHDEPQKCVSRSVKPCGVIVFKSGYFPILSHVVGGTRKGAKPDKLVVCNKLVCHESLDGHEIWLLGQFRSSEHGVLDVVRKGREVGMKGGLELGRIPQGCQYGCQFCLEEALWDDSRRTNSARIGLGCGH